MNGCCLDLLLTLTVSALALALASASPANDMWVSKLVRKSDA